MEFITTIGFAGAALTTFGFLPQVIKGLKTKSMTDVSLGMVLMLTAGLVLWLAYGIMIKDKVIITANIVSLTFNSLLLFLKIKYS